MDDLNIETAREKFKEIIDGLKAWCLARMDTKEGRDQIRRELGCRIEGCEEEEKGFVPFWR